jgi:mannose-6-phosphate isomerase-like protein (cupin superfamily)
MNKPYRSLLGWAEGARKLHIHETLIPDTSQVEPYEHEHKAEEALFVLEGQADYSFAGQTFRAGPGELVFFPSQVRHCQVTYHTPSMRYLVIRTVEEEDPPCCCGEDRPRESASSDTFPQKAK